MPISTSSATTSTAEPARPAQPTRSPGEAGELGQAFLNAFGSQVATISRLQLGLTAEGRAAGGGKKPSEQTAAFADPLGLAVREELTSAGGQHAALPADAGRSAPDRGDASARQHQFEASREGEHRAPGATGDRFVPSTRAAGEGSEQRPSPSESESPTASERSPTPASGAASSIAASATHTATQPTPAAGSSTQVDAAAGVKPATSAVGLGRLEALSRDRPAVRTPATKPQPPAQREAESAQLSAQVSRGLASVLRRGGGTTLIRLQPEALGAVRVHLNLSDANVQARVEATTAQARDLLLQDMQALRTALEQRGLRVEQLEVVLSQTPAEQAKATDRPWNSAERGTGQQPDDPADSKAAEMTADDQRDHAADTDPGRMPPRVSTQGRGSAETAPEDPAPATWDDRAERTGIVRDANGKIRLDAVV